MIYTDSVEGFLTAHVSEEDLDAVCTQPRGDVIETLAHLSVCRACSLREVELREFHMLIRSALRRFQHEFV